MENKQVTKRGLSGWMEEFILGLSKKAESSNPTDTEEDVVEAEVNMGDLDKVVWKDETFRVAFDDKGANVINDFGNTVTSIPGAKSVEEVDHQLNSNEIVASEEASEEDLVNELDKLALSLGEEDEVLEGEEEVTAAVQEEACGPEGDQPEVKEAAVEDENTEDEAAGDEVLSVIASGFEELEATIAALEQRLSSIEQQYARVPQLQDVSTTAPQDEIQHFTESADASAQEINKEKAVDITSPAGRVELSQQAPSEVEQIVTEDAPVAEEASAVEEISVTEEAPQEDAPVEDNKEDKPEVAEEVEGVCEECGNADCKCEGDSEETPVEKLSGVAEKIFQQGVCPETGEELVKSTTASGDFLGVYSPKGGTEYAVDLRTGEIYKHKK